VTALNSSTPHIVAASLIHPPHKAEALIDAFVWRLTSVCRAYQT